MEDTEVKKLEKVALEVLENLAQNAADETVRLQAATTLLRSVTPPW